MAPEARENHAETRSDVWSLGVVGLQMLGLLSLSSHDHKPVQDIVDLSKHAPSEIQKMLVLDVKYRHHAGTITLQKSTQALSSQSRTPVATKVEYTAPPPQYYPSVASSRPSTASQGYPYYEEVAPSRSSRPPEVSQRYPQQAPAPQQVSQIVDLRDLRNPGGTRLPPGYSYDLPVAPSRSSRPPEVSQRYPQQTPAPRQVSQIVDLRNPGGTRLPPAHRRR